jgi:ABC-type cobalamin transport system ATPase subunit
MAGRVSTTGHIELAGLYVDQFPDRDLSRERARRHR